MSFLRVVLLAALMCTSYPIAFAKGAKGGGPHYGGGKHTTSHGGKYQGGSGNSHKGGTYKNDKTGNQYGKHK